MANERREMLEKSTTLYFGPWYRRSPFFESTLAAGCTSYDIYNHMYLPAYYDDPDVEYWALVNGVTMWDVGVERTVEVSGKDADRLIDYITCRDLTKCAVGQGKYMPVIAPDGGIVNDPVLLHVGENRWWMQLADSDAGLYALGVAAGRFDAEVTLPDVHPMQVQGPWPPRPWRSWSAHAIYDIKYYWLGEFEIDGIPVVISRTGWTAIPGFEINVLNRADGAAIWDAVAAAGEEFEIRPIAPCEARRIEAGIFNYGSDMTLDDTPFHVSGMERLVEPQDQDYLGKEALERLRETRGRSQTGRHDPRRRPAPGRTVPTVAGALGWCRSGPGHRCRLVARDGEEHRVHVGPDRALGAGDSGRCRDRGRGGVDRCRRELCPSSTRRRKCRRRASKC